MYRKNIIRKKITFKMSYSQSVQKQSSSSHRGRPETLPIYDTKIYQTGDLNKYTKQRLNNQWSFLQAMRLSNQNKVVNSKRKFMESYIQRKVTKVQLEDISKFLSLGESSNQQNLKNQLSRYNQTHEELVITEFSNDPSLHATQIFKNLEKIGFPFGYRSVLDRVNKLRKLQEQRNPNFATDFIKHKKRKAIKKDDGNDDKPKKNIIKKKIKCKVNKLDQHAELYLIL